MDRRQKRIAEELFHQLASLPRAEQDRRLAQEIDDAEFRQEVERLLRYDRAKGPTELPRPSPKPSSSTELRDGDVVAGHYRIERKLGRGGMGEVYVAVDDRLRRRVALKFLVADLAGDLEQRRRFLREARAASALSHPHVCVIFEVGEDDGGRPFMAMELVEGRSLDQTLTGDARPIPEVIDVAAQIADALEEAHSKGIVHRDIKPANVCLDARGKVKVLDFGLAKRVGDESGAHAAEDLEQTQPGTILGTPAFMSPEQVLARDVDHRTDLYSLGVVIFQLLTTRLPFTGGSYAEITDRILRAPLPSVAELRGDVPVELERIVRRCVERDIERRYASARELRVDLENLRERLGAESSAPSPMASDLEGTTVAVGAAAVETETETAGVPDPALPVVKAAVSPEVITESDVFISYAHVDDEPLVNEREGWIAQLHRNLEIRVEQISGERVKIARLPGPSETVSVDQDVLERLPHAKTMVSVLSPPFVRSSGCRKHVERFWDATMTPPQLPHLSQSRMFKVVKHPVPQGDMPPRLAELFGSLIDFDFFDFDPESGRVRELGVSFSPSATEAYHARVYDLAREISQVLRAFRESSKDSGEGFAPEGEGRLVYLATTTSDLTPERDAIRRELLASGHGVLPDQALPLVGAELESVLRSYLERADFSVHLVGSLHGVVPEGCDESILEVQNRIASEFSRSRGLERLIWLPRDLEVRDGRQATWIDRIRRDPDAHCGADFVENHIEAAKDLLLEKLKPRLPAPPPAGMDVAVGDAPLRVYLICDAADVEDIEPLEDFLFERGLEVSLPDFGAPEDEAAETHRQNLVDCDGVIVFYGRARPAWVDIKLRGLIKAAGYGRSRELSGQIVYAAPPFDRRKERFRTRLADVVRQQGAFDPALFEPFLEKLQNSRGGAK